MSSWAAVFVEPNDFCDAFFATSSDQILRQGVSQSDINPFADLLAAACGEAPTESQLRVTVTKAVNDNGLVPGLKIYQCDKLPGQSPTKPEREEVDPAAFYFEPEAAQTMTTRSWADQVMPVWFEKSEVNDVDVPTRMMAYADLLFAVQQRIALFMLVLVGSRAQFIRWDRSGAVVTRALDYVEDWRFFCDTLWCIGHCSVAQLGFDPTVTRVCDDGDDDYAAMFSAARNRNTVDHLERPLNDGRLPAGEFEYVRQMFEDSLAPGWPRYRVKVPVDVPNEGKPESEKTFREFLIGKPAFCAKGMVGRGTRKYVALDCETKKFRWLKDTWRSDYELVEREGEILARLNEAKVVNVPTMLCHGDICGQKTETPDWWDIRDRLPNDSHASGSEHTLVNPSSSKGKKRQREDDSKESGTKLDNCPLRLHQHYRLVVEEVAMPLDRFEYAQQLIQIILDCVLAHEEAANLSERPLLHRDISSGNILIYPRVGQDVDGEFSLRWRGILADWELSKPFQKDQHQIRTSRQPVRTGTWQYLSVALLSPGPIRVGIADEVESFFHVLLYFALRYTKTANCSGLSVARFLDRYFDTYGFENNMYTCGDTKRLAIKEGQICVDSTNIPVRFDNPLDDLFRQMLSWFRARYVVQAYEDQAEAAKEHQAALSARTTTGTAKRRKPLAEMVSALAGRPNIELLPKTAKPPSDEERTLAERINSHDGIVVALGAALYAEWTEHVVEDQIPNGWKPMPGHFPGEESAAVEKQRKCLQTPASAPAFPVASRPPETPKKHKARSAGTSRKDKSS